MVNSLPLVSIVTPSYNQAPFLRSTIESVLAQDYPHVEYIIMDGGSTDGSVEVIRAYADHLAHWQSAPDGGQANAINAGWQRARGEIVAYLNSDDTLQPQAVRLSVQALQENPNAGLSYGSCAWVNEQGQHLGLMEARPFTVQELLLHNRLAQPSVFVRRAALDHVGMLDSLMHHMLDYDLWLRLALHYPVVRVPELISNFRLHDDSKTASQYKLFLKDNLRLLDKAFANPALPPELKSLRPRATNYAHIVAALHCYSLGQREDGREIMERFFETETQPLAYPQDIVALFADHLVHVAPLRDPNFSAASGADWLDARLSELPPNAQALRALRSRILAHAHLEWGFAAHARGDTAVARVHMVRALRYHPTHARNRGVWSVIRRSFLPLPQREQTDLASTPSHGV